MLISGYNELKRSASSLADGGSFPYIGASSYLGIAKSEPSNVGAALKESWSADENEHRRYCRPTNSKPQRAVSGSVSISC